jgi:hypothetical protein
MTTVLMSLGLLALIHAAGAADRVTGSLSSEPSGAVPFCLGLGTSVVLGMLSLLPIAGLGVGAGVGTPE